MKEVKNEKTGFIDVHFRPIIGNACGPGGEILCLFDNLQEQEGHVDDAGGIGTVFWQVFR
jgi:hypothetical protein